MRDSAMDDGAADGTILGVSDSITEGRNDGCVVGVVVGDSVVGATEGL